MGGGRHVSCSRGVVDLQRIKCVVHIHIYIYIQSIQWFLAQASAARKLFGQKNPKAKRTCLGQKFQGEANSDKLRPKIPRRSAHSLQPTTTCFGPKQQQQVSELRKENQAKQKTSSQPKFVVTQLTITLSQSSNAKPRPKIASASVSDFASSFLVSFGFRTWGHAEDLLSFWLRGRRRTRR
jgi:hypothetical protein